MDGLNRPCRERRKRLRAVRQRHTGAECHGGTGSGFSMFKGLGKKLLHGRGQTEAVGVAGLPDMAAGTGKAALPGQGAKLAQSDKAAGKGAAG